MSKLFELGDRYAKQSTWEDFALTKLCLFSMGLAAGMAVSEKYKKFATVAAGAGFAVSYVPLMVRLLRVATGQEDQQPEN
ncbi:MAG: hypothetical protein IKF18_07040 [Erysipelotrichaceae bacterium]|nr:hypothetical protein [Erysipelotrichaceae bacterium]